MKQNTAPIQTRTPSTGAWQAEAVKKVVESWCQELSGIRLKAYRKWGPNEPLFCFRCIWKEDHVIPCYYVCFCGLIFTDVYCTFVSGSREIAQQVEITKGRCRRLRCQELLGILFRNSKRAKRMVVKWLLNENQPMLWERCTGRNSARRGRKLSSEECTLVPVGAPLQRPSLS